MENRRFALLRHEVPASFARPSHWDLLLEHPSEEIAWAWALEQLPGGWPGSRNSQAERTARALRLKDHRLFYLDYEGPVSGDRGHVVQIASGQCDWIIADGQSLRTQLSTKGASAVVTLTRIEGDYWQVSVQAPA